MVELAAALRAHSPEFPSFFRSQITKQLNAGRTEARIVIAEMHKP
jgi:hypothetical protein